MLLFKGIKIQKEQEHFMFVFSMFLNWHCPFKFTNNGRKDVSCLPLSAFCDPVSKMLEIKK